MTRAARTAILAGTITLALAAPAIAAGPAFQPHTLIVKYRSSATATQRSLLGQAAGLLNRIALVRGTGAQLVRVSGDPLAAAARLRRSPDVAYAEPNYTMHATAIPNDPRFGELYGLNQANDQDIDAPEGWDLAGVGTFPASGGAKVGIVDTGISQHEDLPQPANCAGVNSFGIILILFQLFGDPTVVPNKCADDNGHGSHVAGTIAAVANNGKGVAGVAFNSPLAICKALDSSGAGSEAGVANCITYLNQNGAKVISMSLGGPGSAALQNAVTTATNNGSLIVAAAGNSGDSTVSYPAGYPEVVSVAAVDRNGQRASFSSFNNDVEVAAPGVDILSTYNDGGYRTLSGTSMATPHAAGVAAQIATKFPNDGVAGWRSRLDNGARDIPPTGRDPQTGFGLVRLDASLLP